jgi:hypothetical protein
MHWRAVTDSLTPKRLAEANKLDEKLAREPEKRLPWALPKAKGEGKGSALFRVLDGKSGGKLQAREKVSIDRLSRGGVVLADRAALVRHKEGVAQHR